MTDLSTLHPEVAVGSEAHLVYCFINGELIELTGRWEWDINSNSLFCSDVILPPPAGFEGTAAIFHPDDVSNVLWSLQAAEPEETLTLSFRIITFYGKVKQVKGWCSVVRHEEPPLRVIENLEAQAARQKELEEKEKEHHIFKNLILQSGQLLNVGKWYYNNSTQECWYSDRIYQIHEVVPQSLNAHPNTFLSFIHPDDRKVVTEAFDQSFQHQYTIQLDYRIITLSGKERYISHYVQWQFGVNGELVLMGTMEDITEKTAERLMYQARTSELAFERQVLEELQQSERTGYWYYNVLTRQRYYSANYLKMHGLKNVQVANLSNLLLHHIHPEDRDTVRETLEDMKHSHSASDVEYRVLRSNGTIRYIRQQSKLATYGNHEMVMLFITEDVTAATENSTKVKQLQFVQKRTSRVIELQEEMLKSFGWVWDKDTNEISWSYALSKLLGFAQRDSRFTYKTFLGYVHPEDKNFFDKKVQQVLHDGEAASFTFRLMTRNFTQHIEATLQGSEVEGSHLFMAVFRNVTSERLLEEKLFNDTFLSDLLTDNLPHAVFITDENNTITSWNQSAARQLNVSKEDAIGQNYYDLFPADKENEVIVNFGRVLQGDRITEDIYKHSEFYRRTMIPLKNKERIAGILHILEDITTEHKLKESLGRRLAFIEKLLEETIDRIIVLDKNLVFIYWNRKAELHYHINKEYVIGKNLLEVFPQLINESKYTDIKKAFKGETVYLDATEEDVPTQTYLVPLEDERKNVYSVLWITHTGGGGILNNP